MITFLDSPIGTIGIRAENDLVQQIYLPGKTDDLIADSAPPGGKVGQMLEQLKRYFAGDALEFDLSVLAPCGTPFQQRIRQLCAEIPLGETRRYAELAESAGSPRGARAVGSVMSGNPYAIVIPCHRVLSTTGLGGYAGGLDAKRVGSLPTRRERGPKGCAALLQHWSRPQVRARGHDDKEAACRT